MGKNYFTFYRTYYEEIQELNDKDRLIIYEAIMSYMFTNKEPKLSGMPKLVYGLIKPTLKKSKILSENGRKGGAPIGNQNAKQ